MSIRFYRNTSVASTFWTPVAPLGKPKRGWTAFLCFYTPIAPLGLLFATHEDFFCELRPAQNTQKNQKMLEHSTSTKINCPNFSKNITDIIMPNRTAHSTNLLFILLSPCHLVFVAVSGKQCACG